jgi:hypothetical protein
MGNSNNFRGFEGLNSIGGSLFIQEEWSLTSLEGLDNITSTGELDIVGDRELKTLDGLSRLEEINGRLVIIGNESLGNIRLNKLKSVGGNLPSSGSMNSNLKTPSDWHMEIEYNLILESLEMEMLASVSGTVIVENHAALMSINLDNLSSIGGYFRIEQNAALKTLGMSKLTTLGCEKYYQGQETCLIIKENDVLPQCEACDLLDQLEGFTEEFDFQGNQQDECTEDCE